MAWSDIRTATKLKLESISGVENVLDYVVWTDEWDTILSLFQKDGRINTWGVGLAGMGQGRIEDGLRIKPYILQIVFYYSIKTSAESSKTFEDLVMSVVDSFMANFSYIKTYVPAYAGSSIVLPPTVATVENAVFAQTPAHRARITIPITETEAQDGVCSA